MARFVQVVVDGIADGSIYAALALALVLIFRSTGIVNLAQGGMAVERVLIRPVEGEQPLTLLIVTLGLAIMVNATAGWIWGFTNRGFQRIFPSGAARLGGVALSIESLGIIAV